MIEQEFDVSNILSLNFGVSVAGDSHIIPVDEQIQRTLGDMLRATVNLFKMKHDDWEEYSVSEEYNSKSKIFSPRESEFMEEISSIYDAGERPDLFDLAQSACDISYYFTIFRDSNHRKLVSVRRATQFKGTLSSRNRLVSIIDNTLKLVKDDVLKLDMNFELLVCQNNIYIGDAGALERLAFLGQKIAGAAAERLARIQEGIPFLDLSAISERIEFHPRTARLAVSVAARGDLDTFDRDKIEALASSHGMSLIVTKEGRLRPKATDRHRFLELLDHRRYLSNLTTTAPIPFRARSRQRVKPARISN